VRVTPPDKYLSVQTPNTFCLVTERLAIPALGSRHTDATGNSCQGLPNSKSIQVADARSSYTSAEALMPHSNQWVLSLKDDAQLHPAASTACLNFPAADGRVFSIVRTNISASPPVQVATSSPAEYAAKVGVSEIRRTKPSC